MEMLGFISTYFLSFPSLSSQFCGHCDGNEKKRDEFEKYEMRSAAYSRKAGMYLSHYLPSGKYQVSRVLELVN